jgi:hypothetical protein
VIPQPPCSAIALDGGRKRVGLAGCDPRGLTVTALPALQRRGLEQDATSLAALASRRQAKVMVVGLPLLLLHLVVVVVVVVMMAEEEEAARRNRKPLPTAVNRKRKASLLFFPSRKRTSRVGKLGRLG